MIKWDMRDPDEKEDVRETLREIINVVKEINARLRILCEEVNEKWDK